MLPEISQKCLNENFGASLRLYFIQNPIYGNGNTSAHCMLVCPADASYKQLGPDQTLQNGGSDLDPNYLIIW